MKSARIGAFAVVLAVAAGVGATAITPNAAQNAEKTSSRVGGSLSRHYDEGEKLTYHMTGSNQTWHYQIDANDEVKKDADGTFYEEYAWSGMISDGAAHARSEREVPEAMAGTGRFAVASGFEPRGPENNRTDHGSSDDLQ
jgi:hypothetical protein